MVTKAPSVEGVEVAEPSTTRYSNAWHIDTELRFRGFNMNPVVERLLFAIVDDEPFMSQLVSDMLTSVDVNVDVDVEVFLLGTDFLQSLNLLKFKTIILDLSLPDIDGFEIMDRLAAEAIGISVLLISGHKSATIDAARIYGRGIGLNMLGALSKPFTRNELFSGLGLKT
jgi:FixJ family two-component response regulator